MQLDIYMWFKGCIMYDYVEHLYNKEMTQVLEEIEKEILSSVDD